MGLGAGAVVGLEWVFVEVGVRRSGVFVGIQVCLTFLTPSVDDRSLLN